MPHLLLARGQLAVGEAVQLHALHQLFDTLLVEQLQQLLVLRHAELRFIEQRRALVLAVFLLEQRLGFADQIIGDCRLLAHQLHDLGIEQRVFFI